MPDSIAADSPWSDRIQYRRSIPPRSRRTEPERGPAGGHRYCLGIGAVANTLPRSPEIVISETEKTKHTMQIQAGTTALVVRGKRHEDVRGQSTHAGIRAQHA